MTVYPQVMEYKEYKGKLNGKIKNLESLPGGLKCNYLILIAGLNDELIAKQWKRTRPQLNVNEYLLVW